LLRFVSYLPSRAVKPALVVVEAAEELGARAALEERAVAVVVSPVGVAGAHFPRMAIMSMCCNMRFSTNSLPTT
jgi:hypothetical protein